MRSWGLLITGVYALLLLGLVIPGIAFLGGGRWDWSFYRAWGVWIFVGFFLGGQALLLFLSVDTSRKRLKPRVHVLVSCSAAAILTALLTVAAIWSLGVAAQGDKFGDLGTQWTFGAVWGVLWLLWGTVFYFYFRNSSQVLTRLVSWLLKGSVLELLIVVPCHIIVRRRHDCSAPFVTSFGIATGIAIMLLSFGPGILLLYKKRLDGYAAKVPKPPLERPSLSIMRSMVDARGLLWPVLSASILAWVLAEGVVLPLTEVGAPNVEASVLIVAGLVLVLAMASFVADTAAVRVAPASGMGRGHLLSLILALVPVMLVLVLPFYLLSLSLPCMRDPGSTGVVCLVLALSPFLLIALVCLALRIALAPAVVVLGGTSVPKAFMVSWQLTKGQWGRLLLLGAPAWVLWSGVTLVPVPWPMPWVTIIHGIIGGAASAWLAIVLTLAYTQLAGTIRSEQAEPARSIHKAFIVGMLVFAVAGAGLAAGRRALIPSGPGTIAFTSTRHGTQIYVMNPDGSNVTQLTYAPGAAWSPRFSPDGRRIAFLRARRGRTTQIAAQIAVMNADGSGETPLTDLPGLWGEEFEMEFVLGGSKIAFVSCNRKTSTGCETEGIYLMNADGSNVTHLADLSLSDATKLITTISSDGRKVAFTSYSYISDNIQIYTMNIDGSNVVHLIDRAEEPAFSPHGTKIVFVSDNDGEIYVMNADGSNPSRLTNLPGASPLRGSYPAGVSPKFSPDGRRVVFTSPRDGHQQIYLMNADGSNVTRLTGRWDNRDPTVSP